MGGGSSINVQSANRGLPRDYDEWRDLGARGWGWADVLPYFLKLETDLDFDGPLHGRSGPIPVRRIAHEAMPPFGRAAGEALSATGRRSERTRTANSKTVSSHRSNAGRRNAERPLGPISRRQALLFI